MEQPVPSSVASVTDIPISMNKINEILPSVPSTTIEEKQQTTIPSMHYRKFRFRIGSTKQQTPIPQNKTDTLNDIDSRRISSTLPSMADYKLKEIIDDLKEIPMEEEAFEEETFEKNHKSATGRCKCLNQSRHFIRHLTERPAFHYGIIILVIFDLIIVFIELTLEQLSAPCLTDEEMERYNISEQRSNCLLPPSPQLETGELALFYISFIIISIFVLEILISFYAFGWRRYTKILFLLDAIIVLASFILETYFHFGSALKAGRASAALVVLRMWKVVRAIHAIAHSISLRNHILMNKIKGAHTILQQEILQAQKTIDEQNIKINDLILLLNTNHKTNIQDQINQLTPTTTTNSVDSLTYF